MDRGAVEVGEYLEAKLVSRMATGRFGRGIRGPHSRAPSMVRSEGPGGARNPAAPPFQAGPLTPSKPPLGDC